MAIDSETQDMLDSLYLRLLYQGGLDNWEWYSESISDLPDNADDNAIVNALANGGVDNWEWYDESLGEFSSYSDYVNDNPANYLSYNEWIEAENNKDSETVGKTVVETIVEPEMSDQNKALLEYIQKNSNEVDSQRIYEVIVSTFWKRSVSPKDFEKSLKITAPGHEYIKEVAMNYLALMIKNKKLDKMIQEVS